MVMAGTLALMLTLTVTVKMVVADLGRERGALLALREAVGGRTLLWNATSESPCRWAGVECEKEHVVELHLPGVALSGEIPVGIFGNLSELRTLSLRFNALRGSLPSDLASCVNLRNLYIQRNLLSGPIPPFLFHLPDLVRLNLAFNNFSGPFPPAFNNLSRLKTLFLENNRLSGPIPDLPQLSLDQFNVSYNLLNGSLPLKLRTFPLFSFLGNSLCGPPLSPCPSHVADPISVDNRNANSSHHHHFSSAAIAAIVVGSFLFLLLLLLLLLFIFLCRNNTSKKTTALDLPTAKHPDASLPDVENGLHPNGNSAVAAAPPIATSTNKAEGPKKLLFFGNAARAFDLEDLLRASAEVLGKGTFGTAYKAVLEAGPVVAVKRLKDVTISETEFREKIEAVGAMDHETLVPLRAYYFSRDEKLLVYDYMPMGSLSALLHGNKGAGRTPLNWEVRSGIALGAARGIEYLHSKGPNVSHGNIKSSNILLTKSYDARVSDFGLAHLVGPSSTPNRVAGYRAPEVTDPRKVSQKADVYSFGVLLLELLTGKAPTHALLNEEGVDLPRWVQSVVREEWTSEVFDLELLRYQNVEEEMVQLLQLAVDCAAQYPDKRPSMSEVVRSIQELRRSSLKEDQDRIQHDPVNDIQL
ncbi:hypothetical protein VNO78_09958 [Psophocarpus tetragonolobus]|uniref:Protein kinase domain-containing protein n=1 Tax=Psophocarpus tetragonolobus TaxID=3891 RepID=A0AAN9XMA1_PSOTE